MFLLDTNVLSEVRKTRRGGGDAKVAAWAASVSANSSYVSVMSIYEIERGIALVARRDLQQSQGLRGWLEDSVIQRYEGRILPVTEAIARRAALLSVPDPLPFTDSLIAATALVHGLTVVTRNTNDFRACPTLNPFL